MRKRNVAISALVGAILALVLLLLTMNLTNPADGGPAIILAVLLLIYGLTYSIFVLFVMLFWHIYRLAIPKGENVTTSEVKYKRAIKRALIICAVVAAAPIMVISLSSLGKMSLFEGMLILVTELVACGYVVKRT